MKIHKLKMKTDHKWFKMAKKGQKAEVFIYDSIGGGFFGGVDPKAFADELKSLGDVNEIDVRVNSPGGSVFDGITIYNLLKQHPAQVNVFIDGLAASIASVIALAGDTVIMAETAFFMIHNPFTMAMGESKDLRKSADLLDQIKDTIINVYSDHSELTTQQLTTFMDDETWFTASEAHDHGFVDVISEPMEQAASADKDQWLDVFDDAPFKTHTLTIAELPSHKTIIKDHKNLVVDKAIKAIANTFKQSLDLDQLEDEANPQKVVNDTWRDELRILQLKQAEAEASL